MCRQNIWSAMSYNFFDNLSTGDILLLSSRPLKGAIFEVPLMFISLFCREKPLFLLLLKVFIDRSIAIAFL
jgi:hypothetical protein